MLALTDMHLPSRADLEGEVGCEVGCENRKFLKPKYNSWNLDFLDTYSYHTPLSFKINCRHYTSVPALGGDTGDCENRKFLNPSYYSWNLVFLANKLYHHPFHRHPIKTAWPHQGWLKPHPPSKSKKIWNQQ